MKLTENVQFDRNELKVLGYVDLGSHTPPNKEGQLGDHALVLLFQPLAGQWLQPIGSFLSRGAATNTILYQILMEAVILLENSGFHVDGVVSDAASWNRSMWGRFGIDEQQCSCQHLCDENRRLWFFSDFPHLIKNLRNWMWRMHIFHTPDGTVKKSHWSALLKADNPEHGFHLRQCPKLTSTHLNPQHYQKMNVALAYQIFDDTVSSAMQYYHEKENNVGLPDCEKNLLGCENTVAFMKRIRRLIECMSGRYPKNSLRTSGVEEIKSFLEFLDQWEVICELERVQFLTESTSLGLKVTLKSTIELYDYLTTKHDFKYLMTARLNQDNLEKFFGIVRAAGGNNDHPDSVMFAYIYKLLGAYSLLKTVKGSNVENNGEALTSFQDLMQNNVLVNKQNQDASARQKWDMQLDRIVNAGKLFDFPDDSEFFTNLTEEESAALIYLCGYIIRNTKKFTNCEACFTSVEATGKPTGKFYRLIQLRDYYDVLKYPSDALCSLCMLIEEVILTELKTEKDLGPDSFFSIAGKLEESLVPLIGCVEHQEQFTKKVLNFFLIMRMNFICRQFNRNLADLEKKKKEKMHKKSAKL